MGRVRELLPDLLTGVDTALGQGDRPTASALVVVAARVASGSSLTAMLQRVLDAEGPDGDELCAVRRCLALQHLRQGDRQAARRLLTDALVDVQRRRDRVVEQGRVLALLGTVERLLGRAQVARGHLEEALRIARDEGDGPLEAEALVGLGAVHHELGPRSAAARCYAQAADRFASSGDIPREASARLNLAMTHEEAGRLTVAGEGYRVAHDRYEAAGDPRGMATALLGLGRVALVRAPDQAASSFRAALATHARAGDRHREAEALTHLAVSDRVAGQLEASRDALEKALERVQIVGDVRLEAIVWIQIARTAVDSGQPSRARSAAETALRLATDGAYADVLGTARGLLARLTADSGDLDGALFLLDAAERELQSVTSLEELGLLHAERARICARLGDSLGVASALASARECAATLGAAAHSELGRALAAIARPSLG